MDKLTATETALLIISQTPTGTATLVISYKDLFTGLSLAILKEPMASGDMKMLTFYSMLSYLKDAGYTDEQITILKGKIHEIIKTLMTTNDFMG